MDNTNRNIINKKTNTEMNAETNNSTDAEIVIVLSDETKISQAVARMVGKWEYIVKFCHSVQA